MVFSDPAPVALGCHSFLRGQAANRMNISGGGGKLWAVSAYAGGGHGEKKGTNSVSSGNSPASLAQNYGISA